MNANHHTTTAGSLDGRLTVELSVPKEIGGEGGPGTNPEQLFAVGYAAASSGTPTRAAA
ncbi:MAG TPA: hypothetical protein VN325_30670 [Steroidobacteraceae bacterium]|nr:hypothetical protein [Steroidobacteraceae bacterium]